MGIALFTLSTLFAPLQAFASRLAPAHARSASGTGRHPARASASRQRPEARPAVAARSHDRIPRNPARHVESDRQAHRSLPLRVVRNIESGMPAGSSGRMVISGRMADVCAELERLAAKESARQGPAR